MTRHSERLTIGVTVALILLGAVLRIFRHDGLLPLPPNVAPVTALALLSAAYLPRRWGWMVPLGIMIGSDLIIGTYTWQVMMSVYLSFAAGFGVGFWLRRRVSASRLLAASLIASSLFFLVTNAAVWAFQTMYPHTLAGLGQAYVAGMPFFRNTLVGDLGYSGIFFGLRAVLVVYSRRLMQRISVAPHA